MSVMLSILDVVSKDKSKRGFLQRSQNVLLGGEGMVFVRDAPLAVDFAEAHG